MPDSKPILNILDLLDINGLSWHDQIEFYRILKTSEMAFMLGRRQLGLSNTIRRFTVAKQKSYKIPLEGNENN